MPVEKICVVCSKPFSVPPCRAETATTCSNECAISVRAKSRERKQTCNCKKCGKEFIAPRSQAIARVYCSKECKYSDEQWRKDISDRGLGDKNPMWQGGDVRRKDGYLYESSPDHPFSSNGYVLKHRLVMEQWLREDVKDSKFLQSIAGVEYLSAEFDVHHMDRCKSNNDRSNLIVCTKQTHRSIHSGYGVNEGTFWPERADIALDHVDPKVRQKERRRIQRIEKKNLVNRLLAEYRNSNK